MLYNAHSWWHSQTLVGSYVCDVFGWQPMQMSFHLDIWALLYFKISEVTILSITHTSTSVFCIVSGDSETLEFLKSWCCDQGSKSCFSMGSERLEKFGSPWWRAGMVWDSLGCTHWSVLQDFHWNHRRSDIASRLLECARFNHKEEITAVTCNRDWHQRCLKIMGQHLQHKG